MTIVRTVKNSPLICNATNKKHESSPLRVSYPPSRRLPALSGRHRGPPIKRPATASNGSSGSARSERRVTSTSPLAGFELAALYCWLAVLSPFSGPQHPASEYTSHVGLRLPLEVAKKVHRFRSVAPIPSAPIAFRAVAIRRRLPRADCLAPIAARRADCLAPIASAPMMPRADCLAPDCLAPIALAPIALARIASRRLPRADCPSRRLRLALAPIASRRLPRADCLAPTASRRVPRAECFEPHCQPLFSTSIDIAMAAVSVSEDTAAEETDPETPLGIYHSSALSLYQGSASNPPNPERPLRRRGRPRKQQTSTEATPGLLVGTTLGPEGETVTRRTKQRVIAPPAQLPTESPAPRSQRRHRGPPIKRPATASNGSSGSARSERTPRIDLGRSRVPRPLLDLN
uniref:Uncharacterized protein n=1 Tax=Heliothis virescens TaxID=7102 RepID=A0A2A4JR98_HELVI